MNRAFILALGGILSPEQMIKDEPMEKHTSFKAGGRADLYVTPGTPEQLREAIRCCNRFCVAYAVIGNGTNILVRDKGFRGVIIEVGAGMRALTVLDGGRILAEAGAKLSSVAACAHKNALTGFEFAAGIPGTVGGAVAMNAGAYGGEIKDVFISALLLERDGQMRIVFPDEMAFGYRESKAQKDGSVILNCCFQLQKGNPITIGGTMRELNRRRADKQPLDKASAGSTFKRPAGYFAGKLIMDSGLRGFAIGGAQVSEKHCGFIVNNGGATAADVLALIAYVRETVLARQDVLLEPEIKIIGDE